MRRLGQIFQRGDPTDEGLRTTLAHEYLRAQIALDEFRRLAKSNIDGEQSITHRLEMYDSYGRFLHHLYEFYVGCMVRDRRDTAGIDYGDKDRIICEEVNRARTRRAERIRSGRAPSWENAASTYDDPAPAEFGRHFRLARNRIAHADHRRPLEEEGISLPDFYRKYHGYVIVLFEEPYWLWYIKNPDKQDWGEIGAFDLRGRDPLELGRDLSPLWSIGYLARTIFRTAVVVVEQRLVRLAKKLESKVRPK